MGLSQKWKLGASFILSRAKQSALRLPSLKMLQKMTVHNPIRWGRNPFDEDFFSNSGIGQAIFPFEGFYIFAGQIQDFKVWVRWPLVVRFVDFSISPVPGLPTTKEEDVSPASMICCFEFVLNVPSYPLVLCNAKELLQRDMMNEVSPHYRNPRTISNDMD
ncbi:hypothetical protein PIB30_040322 [Stylosanthes scabra]|uniref:Uncharacterized protein n=1 Tax=Stylosanthes scabra TaxID=79078 RepID=A0ABU6SG75_9FABA|nr:hypothetical protein [Stylosanthes scabra]